MFHSNLLLAGARSDDLEPLLFMLNFVENSFELRIATGAETLLRTWQPGGDDGLALDFTDNSSAMRTT